MLFRQKQQIVICLIAAVMLVGFVCFRYLPLRRQIKALEREKAAQALTVTKSTRQIKQLPALMEQALELQQDVANYELAIPPDRGLGTFLHTIADLMNEHNFKEQLIQPADEIKGRSLNCIPVNMQCKGKLDQIFEFFKSLQTLDRAVRIQRVKIANDSNFSGSLTVRTEAIIYYGAGVGEFEI